ncbi:Neurotransmitter-gated ion-channel ligand binding domain family protein [Acanthocheilonema viteae]
MNASRLLQLTVAILHVNDLLSNRYADQLYEDLLYFYNKNVRPVRNASNAVQVKFGASLIRIIDVVSFYNFTLLISKKKKSS